MPRQSDCPFYKDFIRPILALEPFHGGLTKLQTRQLRLWQGNAAYYNGCSHPPDFFIQKIIDD